MKNKYNQKYENQIILLAQSKVESGHYKIYDLRSWQKQITRIRQVEGVWKVVK